MKTTALINLSVQFANQFVHHLNAHLGGGVVAGIVVAGWFLSKGDKFIGRAFRIILTLGLLSYAFEAMHTGNEMDGPVVINHDLYAMTGMEALILLTIACFLWAPKVAHTISEMVLPLHNDNRPLNDVVIRRDSDRLAKLVCNGQKSAARRLAKQMKRSGNHSVLAMDAMIARLS